MPSQYGSGAPGSKRVSPHPPRRLRRPRQRGPGRGVVASVTHESRQTHPRDLRNGYEKVDAIVGRAQLRHERQSPSQPQGAPAHQGSPSSDTAAGAFVLIAAGVLAAYAFVDPILSAVAWLAAGNLLLGAVALFSALFDCYVGYRHYYRARPVFNVLELVLSVAACTYYILQFTTAPAATRDLEPLFDLGAAIGMFVHASVNLRSNGR